MGVFDNVKNTLKNTKDKKGFKYLDEMIHSGSKEIVLDSDILLASGEKSIYDWGIKLDVDDLTIDGNGHVIDGAGKRRILWILGKNIQLKNIHFRNGNVVDAGGGAIYNKGEITVEDCTFTDNTAVIGGAICNEGELSVRRSTFTSNMSRETIKSRLKSYGYTTNDEHGGGAIYNYKTLKISESVLCENSAEKRGGVIYNNGGKRYRNDPVVEIFKTQLINNSSKKEGGSIFNAGEMTIAESEISKNALKEISESEDVEGIIRNKGEMTITRSSVSENESNDYGVIVNSKLLKFWDCEILHNSSPLNIITNWAQMEVNNSDFKNNKSKKIIENGSEGNLNLFGGTFSDNDVSYALVTNWGKSCSVERTVFKNPNSNCLNNYNSMTLVSPKIFGDSKCILNEGHILLKNESEDLKNQISGNGRADMVTDLIPKGKTFDFGYLEGKIKNRSGSEIVLEEDIILEKYEYDYYEGGVELDVDGLVIDGKGHTIDGAGRSRIFLVLADNITLKNIIFKNGRSHINYNNPSNTSGAAIRVLNRNLTVENCKFIENNSEEFGGAIHQMKGELLIRGCEFHKNTAITGAAILCEKGRLTIEKSLFLKNTSDLEGGAIYSAGSVDIEDMCVLSLVGSQFIENSAGFKGGAIRDYFGRNYIVNCIFESNTAREDDGGAIFIYGAVGDIKGCTFSKNSAGKDGGAVFKWCPIFEISDSILSENTAKRYGGAIGAKGESTISETTFIGNKSKKGAVYNINSKKSMKNGKVGHVAF